MGAADGRGATGIPWNKTLIQLATAPFIAFLAYGFTTNPRAVSSPLLRKPASPVMLQLFAGRLHIEPLLGTP